MNKLKITALSILLALALAGGARGQGLRAATFTPEELWQVWPEARLVTTPAPCLRPAELETSLRALEQRHQGRLKLEEVGRSVQGRAIHLLTLGNGPRKVLLWSQMHGDEPSATPALLDIADYLLSAGGRPSAQAILDQLTLLMVPMLNPDGSEIYQRRNAQGIDVNRDALNLATPEGRLLKRLREEHQPMLGFNLHDQNRRTAVGDTGVLATNAVLAVAGDPEGTVTPGRLRAKRACSAIVKALAPFVPGGMARYDEDWSPRSFGDNLTAWGTPVVLIESGGLPDGVGFPDLTRLNFVAILSVLQDLVRDDLAGHDPQVYEDLKRNQSDSWVDVAVRGGSLLQPGMATPYRADLAFNLARDDRREAGCEVVAGQGSDGSRIFEIGDARFLAAGHEIDAAGRLVLAPFVVEVRGWSARRWLDGPALERLARLGVGEVRWTVPDRRLAAAEAIAGRFGAPGRSRLEPVAVPRSRAAPASATGLRLTGPPAERDAAILDEVMAALGAGALEELWPAAVRPAIRRGRPASFLVVASADGADSDLGSARLIWVWLDGVKVPAMRP